MIRIPLLVLGLVLGVLACGGGPQRAATLPELHPRHERIDELDQSITSAEQQMATGAALCPDVCRLADDICKAKDDICRISGDSPGDGWARGRCDQASQSCADARGRCTGCR